MKFILFVFFLLISISLFAQAADSLQQNSTVVVTANFDRLGVNTTQPDSIDTIVSPPDNMNAITTLPDSLSNTTTQMNSSGYYTVAPDNARQHDEMAYQYMLTGHYADALQEYQAAIALDAQDADARKGVLWANNSLQRWKDTISMGLFYLKIYGYDSDIDLYMAYAYFAREDYLHARQSYEWSAIAWGWYAANSSGMAWTFRMLGDYAKEKVFTRKWESVVPDSLKGTTTPPPPPLYLAHIQFAYANWNDHERAFLHHYTAQYQTISVTSGVEDVWRRKDHLRTDYLASLKWYTIYSNIEWRGHWLRGDYKNLYPAYSHWLCMNKPLYIMKTEILPEISASYSHYPVLSVFQQELKISYIRDAKWVSYSDAFIYQDNISPGMDERNQWATWDIGARFFTDFSIDLYASLGNRTFYVGREIGVVDNYVSAKRQYGLFLLYHYKILNMGFNYSKEKQTDGENSTTTSFTLGLDYSPAKSH